MASVILMCASVGICLLLLIMSRFHKSIGLILDRQKNYLFWSDSTKLQISLGRQATLLMESFTGRG
jgi:hypothetical protein